MKKIIVIVTALFFSITFVGNILAGEIKKGTDDRGVKLFYDGFNLGSNGVVRFSLECVKNWGGQVGGVVTVVAYYIDNSGEIKEASDSASCHVTGGDDGAKKKRKGDAKSIKIPVVLSDAVVKAYIDYKEISNIADALKKLENEINKIVKEATAGVVNRPLSVGETLEQAVVPVGGDKLTF